MDQQPRDHGLLSGIYEGRAWFSRPVGPYMLVMGMKLTALERGVFQVEGGMRTDPPCCYFMPIEKIGFSGTVTGRLLHAQFEFQQGELVGRATTTATQLLGLVKVNWNGTNVVGQWAVHPVADD